MTLGTVRAMSNSRSTPNTTAMPAGAYRQGFDLARPVFQTSATEPINSR